MHYERALAHNFNSAHRAGLSLIQLYGALVIYQHSPDKPNKMSKMSKMPNPPKNWRTRIMVSLRSVFSLSSFAFQLRNILAQYAQN
jgi:hypothetical protein